LTFKQILFSIFNKPYNTPMNWFLIVNDIECKKDLEAFLKKHSGSVILKSETNKAFNNINRVINGFNNIAGGTARIAINAANTVNVLKINDIVHCESQRSYTQLYLKDGNKLTVTKTLKQFEQELMDYHFIRIHQSHLVNLNYIEKYVKNKGGCVVLSNGSKLPVAIRKKEILFKELEQL
jgi:two-component system LytT family response regulator